MAFNIVDHLDALTHKGRGRYICPVCNGGNLTINKKTGAYKCWTNECESALIRQAIAPLDEMGDKPSKTKAKTAPKPKAKPVLVNLPDVVLATLPGDCNPPMGYRINQQIRTFYQYGNGHQVMRTDFEDGSPKEIKPQYRQDADLGSLAINGKGDRPWDAYKIDEVCANSAGKFALLVEGEKCVEALRSIGLSAFTFNGSGWTDADFSRAIVRLKDHDVGVIICPDNDEPGQKKADHFLDSCAQHNHPALKIDPKDYWDKVPDKGDVADWIAFFSDNELIDQSFYRQMLNQAIALACDRQPEPKPVAVAETTTELKPVATYDETEEKDDKTTKKETEDYQEPDLTYQEIARQEIYGKGHYVVINGEFFAFNGTHYEQRHQSEEIKKIRAWAGQYRMYNKRTGRWAYSLLSTKSINEIWKWVLLCYEKSPEVINPPGVNLANGVLRITWKGNIPSWKLCPHTPKDVYLYCSPVAYDPKANPTNCDRLLQCLDPAPRTALLRHLSAAFDLEKVRTFASRQIRAGIAKGTGSNGKDSIRAAIAKIFGAQMTCIDLGDFLLYDQGKRFYLKDFAFARVNWSSENNQETPLDKSQILNICITGEDNALLIEEKNVKAYRTTCKAIQIFNCNQLPRLKSGMDSLATRFVIYDFNKTFKSNPNLQKGELPADPRFHDDPEFLIKEVCPALLNKLLEELGNLAKFGIDYGEMDKGLERLKEQSSHLWQFANDTGLEADSNGRVWVSDLWETLRNWYVDNGTLEIIPMDNGKTKNVWHEQANKYDTNVTGANQIHKRVKQLFPKIERMRETQDPNFKGRFYLSGISFNTTDSASLLHNPTTVYNSASPTASPTASPPLLSSLPSPFSSEAESEGRREAENIAGIDGEAEKQNPQPTEKNHTQEFSINDFAMYLRTRELVKIVALPDLSSIQRGTFLYRCLFVENPLTEKMIPLAELRRWQG